MFSNIVDKIYVITRPKDKQRFNDFIKRLPFDHNLLKVHIMVDQENFEDKYLPNNGSDNAHQLVARDAINNNYNKILVFEDDARFNYKIKTKKIKKMLGRVLTNMSYLVNNYIIRTNGSPEIHTVCYNRKMMDLLVNIKFGALQFNYFSKRDHNEKYLSADNFFRTECPHVKAYAVLPTMFYQNNFSGPKRES